MLQVARLAPTLLGESRDLVSGFLQRSRHADGGFQDRSGEDCHAVMREQMRETSPVHIIQVGKVVGITPMVSKFVGEGFEMSHNCS